MKPETIAVIGLGYVGLPLACALSKHFEVTGFDVSEERIEALKQGVDATGEVSADELGALAMKVTTDEKDIKGRSCYIITVPTPVDSSNRPDLSHVLHACKTVGRAMGRGAVVALESTVYPGVTQDVCGPALERAGGLACGEDFFLGYSPERINPGDKKHRLDTVTKVVSGQDARTLARLAEIYGKVAPVFQAKDIRTAEAAKVIENAQRDVNIAFVNELSIIFHKLGLDTQAVLKAAGTKWNFLPFQPGLVGGHCIGVDPFYLTYASQKAGYHPEVILSGRRINDDMGRFVGTQVAKLVMKNSLPARALVLGVTFKENVPDIRNTKSKDVIDELESYGFTVDAHDPMADASHTSDHLRINLVEPSGKYGAIILTVAHDEFREWDKTRIESLLADGGVVADIKGAWKDYRFSSGTITWRL